MFHPSTEKEWIRENPVQLNIWEVTFRDINGRR